MKKLLIAPILAITIALTGCSSSVFDSVVSTAAPILVSVLQIVAISENKPFNQTLATKITNDAANIKSIGDQLVKSADVGGCQAFLADLNAFQADISIVEQTAQVSNPTTQQKVTTIVGLAVGIANGIAANLPACKATTSDAQFGHAIEAATRKSVADAGF